jgi:alpha-aminoadipate carrier protein LysW
MSGPRTPSAPPSQGQCPECEAAVPIPADAVPGEIVACPSCRAELELLALAPPELALAPELAEDWGE